jgi:hypothetical protein
MKNQFTFPILFLFVVVCAVSCKKDEVPSPCDGISCVNGGTCVNGECDCPEGYTGPDCSDQQTPSAIKIEEIRCTSFPATDGGAGWDLTSAAEIYVTLERNGNTFYESGYYENANPSLTYTFTPTGNLNMTSPLDSYNIRLYDFDDFDADDFMGGISFTPYSSTNGFPETINVQFGDLSFELDVTYIY